MKHLTTLVAVFCLASATLLAAQDEKTETNASRKLGQAEKLKAVAIEEIAAAHLEEDREKRSLHQMKARDLLVEARGIYTEVLDIQRIEWRAFPVFIDRKENREQFAARSRAEVAYIMTQLENANCFFQQAQTVDVEDTIRAELLQRAAKEYEDIHQKYRSMLGGLFARVWQGRCFQEQGDIRSALGIYRELLAHPGRSPQMQSVQDHARHFRLTCLNHPQQREYSLVIDDAREWLKDASEDRANSGSGQGIRWEFARALELLARRDATTPEDRTRLLNEALEATRALKSVGGPFQKAAEKKANELEASLNP